jgi:hypothetical protein
VCVHFFELVLNDSVARLSQPMVEAASASLARALLAASSAAAAQQAARSSHTTTDSPQHTGEEQLHPASLVPEQFAAIRTALLRATVDWVTNQSNLLAECATGSQSLQDQGCSGLQIPHNSVQMLAQTWPPASPAESAGTGVKTTPPGVKIIPLGGRSAGKAPLLLLLSPPSIGSVSPRRCSRPVALPACQRGA